MLSVEPVQDALLEGEGGETGAVQQDAHLDCGELAMMLWKLGKVGWNVRSVYVAQGIQTER